MISLKTKWTTGLLIDKKTLRTLNTAHLRVHVVLKREDDGEGRGLKGTLCDSLNHLLKHNQKETTNN